MRDGIDRAALLPAIRGALDGIKDPCSVASGIALGLDEMGMVDTIDVAADGKVTIGLRLTAPFCHMIGFFKTEAAARISALPGVTAVDLVADNGLDWSPSRMSASARLRRQDQIDRMQNARRTIAA